MGSDDRVTEAIDEVGEHPGDAVHFRGEQLVLGFEVPEIVRQEQQVVELTGGSLGNDSRNRPSSASPLRLHPRRCSPGPMRQPGGSLVSR